MFKLSQFLLGLVLIVNSLFCIRSAVEIEFLKADNVFLQARLMEQEAAVRNHYQNLSYLYQSDEALLDIMTQVKRLSVNALLKANLVKDTTLTLTEAMITTIQVLEEHGIK